MRTLVIGLLLGLITPYIVTSQSFTIYDQGNTPAFTTNFFKQVAQGKHGHIWAGSNANGLYKFNGTDWVKAPNLTNYNIRAILAEADSTVLVGHSGSNGSQAINGGLHRFTDSVFTPPQYWGFLGGLPSRWVNGCCVDNTGRIWTANGQSLIGSTINEGGIGYKDPGDANFSILINGLPASDRRVVAIATNDFEVWAGIDRSCISGNCASAGIVRYSNNGQFIQKLDATNTPIPFTNTVSGPAVRSIFFEDIFTTWVGLSTGGLAVCESEAWTLVNETNSRFPAGAAVSPNAIAKDPATGRVYIGTTMGLLVYKGGAVTDTNSYLLYTLANGLPSNNITGVYCVNTQNIWLTTGAGIVKMNDQSNTISGYVYDRIIQTGPGTIANVPLASCKVRIRPGVGNLFPPDSVLTDQDGFFSFTVDPDLAYVNRIEVVGETFGQQVLLKYAYVIPGTQLACYLPNNTMDKIKGFNNLLSKHIIPASFFDGWIVADFTLATYDTLSIHKLLLDHDTVTESHEEYLEALTRLYIAMRALYFVNENAAALSTELVKSSMDIAASAFSAFKIYKNSKKLPKAPQPTELEKVEQIRKMVDVFSLKFNSLVHNELLDRAIQKTNDPLAKQILIKTKASIRVIERYGSSDSFNEYLKEQLKSVLGELFVAMVIPQVYKQYYVEGTQGVLENMVDNVYNRVYQDNFSNAYTHTLPPNSLSLVTQSNNAAQDRISTISTANLVSSCAALASDLMDIVDKVKVTEKWPLWKVLGKSIKVVNWGAKGTALYTSASGIARHKSNANYIDGFAYGLYSHAGSYKQAAPGQMGLLPSVPGDLAQAALQYQTLLADLSYALQNMPRDSVILLFPALIQADSALNHQVQLATKPVYASIPDFAGQIPAFDSLLDQTLGHHQDLLSQFSLAVGFELISYAVDTVVPPETDTLLIDIQEAIAKVDSFLMSLNYIYSLIDTIPTQAYLQEQSAVYQAMMEPLSQQSLAITLKNHGTAGITGVYAKIALSGGFTTPLDSVYIGTIGAGQVHLLEFVVQSPLNDTIGSYEIALSSDNGRSDNPLGTLVCAQAIDPPACEDISVSVNAPVPPFIAVGQHIQWYADSSLRIFLHAGDTLFVSDTLPGQYPYYVTQSTNYRESLPRKVSLTISSGGTGNTVSGTVTYNNDQASPLAGTTVSLVQGGDTLQQVSADTGGAYHFNGVADGNYEIAVHSQLAWGGVNAIDALLIMNHFVGSNVLTGLRYQVADVSGDAVRNSIDALLTMRRFVGLINAFATGDWFFEPVTIQVQGQNLSRDIQGLCTGDVNATYTP